MKSLPETWDQDFSEDGVVDAVRAYKERWEKRSGTIPDEESALNLQNYYFNCIQDSDNNLMDLLEGLEDLGMMDNTAIVFTSDHGEMHSAHGLKGKGGFIYENNVHVPLIIYYSGMEGGRSIDAVTSHIDLAPTIIDMANISEEEKEKLSEGMTGHSLMGLLAGEEDTVRDGALFCYEMLSFNTAVEKGEDGELGVSFDERNFVRAVFTERYKFGRYFSPNDFNTPETYEELTEHNDLELYDLEK